MDNSEPRGLSEWSDQIADDFDHAAKNFSNEMELREHVHRQIAHALKDLYVINSLASSGELNTKKNGSRSPVDRLYGGVVVEWEWDMKNARREHGAQQALDYLANIREHHTGIGAYTAVVADGLQWGFLKFDPESDVPDLLVEPKPDKAADHFVWVENSPAAVRQFLQLVGSHEKSPITSKSLAVRFGPSSEVATRLVTVLGQSMAGRLPSDRTDTLYVEWRRALDVVYGDLSQSDSVLAAEVQRAYRTPFSRPLGELLFVLHTYFALVRVSCANTNCQSSCVCRLPLRSDSNRHSPMNATQKSTQKSLQKPGTSKHLLSWTLRPSGPKQAPHTDRPCMAPRSAKLEPYTSSKIRVSSRVAFQRSVAADDDGPSTHPLSRQSYF